MSLDLIIKTKRLIIRPMGPGDYNMWRSAHLEMTSSKNKFDHGPKPKGSLKKSDFRKILKHEKSQRLRAECYTFGIFLKAEGRLIGGVSLMQIARKLSQSAYLGYGIFNPYWRKGYGKEAASACIDWGFSKILLHRIEAGVEPGNKNSIKLAKSLGLRLEGKSPRKLYLRNKWRDILNFAVTCEERGYKLKMS